MSQFIFRLQEVNVVKTSNNGQSTHITNPFLPAELKIVRTDLFTSQASVTTATRMRYLAIVREIIRKTSKTDVSENYLTQEGQRFIELCRDDATPLQIADALETFMYAVTYVENNESLYTRFQQRAAELTDQTKAEIRKLHS